MYGSSIYHAMYLKMERRFSDGFSVLGSYTWSKLIDDVVPSRTGFPGICLVCGVPQNYYDLRGDRSVSVYNTPHNLAVSYVYELPVDLLNVLSSAARASVPRLPGWRGSGVSKSSLCSPERDDQTAYEDRSGSERSTGRGRSAKTAAERSWIGYATCAGTVKK